MRINISKPKRARDEKQAIRELYDWADKLADALNLIVSNIGEENLSADLIEKIKGADNG